MFVAQGIIQFLLRIKYLPVYFKPNGCTDSGKIKTLFYFILLLSGSRS